MADPVGRGRGAVYADFADRVTLAEVLAVASWWMIAGGMR